MPQPHSHSTDHEKPETTESSPADRTTTDEGPLAGFALLADPGTIAGTDESSPPPDRDEEIARLRAALHLRSQEIEVLQRKWTRSDANADESEPDGDLPRSDGHERESTLLDADSARRLAADARDRERASRAALADAERALGQARAFDPIRPAVAEDAPNGLPSENGWTRIPLESRQPLQEQGEAAAPEATTLPAQTDAKAPAAPSLDAPVAPLDPAGLRGDRLDALDQELQQTRAELRESEATLALARASTRSLRETVATLREGQTARDSRIQELEQARVEASAAAPEDEPEREAASAPPSEAPSSNASLTLSEPTPTPMPSVVESLRASLEAETEGRRRLEKELVEARALGETRREQIDALHDRLAAQDRALDAARRETDLQRARHTRCLRTLDRLRSALDDGESTPPHQAEDSDRPDVAPAALTPAHAPADVETPTPPTPTPSIEPTPSKLPAAVRRTRLMDRWLDRQIQRRFGSIGIDRFCELLRAPLARRGKRRMGPGRILLCGPDVVASASALATGLVATDVGDFTLHVLPSGDLDLDLDEGEPSRLGRDDPARAWIRLEEPIASPTAFAAALERLRPDVVVCRDLLSEAREITPWRAALCEAHTRGAALLFDECPGPAPAPLSAPLLELAERIWSRLPERYVRDAEGSPLLSWQAASEAVRPRPRAPLFEALQDVFPFEFEARFGLLIAPFLEAPIAHNFDPDDDRDQRFLAQLADLDERPLEGGERTGVRGIALVDGLAEAAN